MQVNMDIDYKLLYDESQLRILSLEQQLKQLQKMIMKISGHKSVKNFHKYIKIPPEQAGQKMREIWEKRVSSQVLNISQW